LAILLTLGLALWSLYKTDVMIQNFNSHTDFVDNKLSEIEPLLNYVKVRFESHEINTGEAITLTSYALDLLKLDHDIVAYDFYSHGTNYLHLDKQYNMVPLTSGLERELSLVKLEQNIQKRAQDLKVDIKTRRPTG